MQTVEQVAAEGKVTLREADIASAIWSMQGRKEDVEALKRAVVWDEPRPELAPEWDVSYVNEEEEEEEDEREKERKEEEGRERTRKEWEESTELDAVVKHTLNLMLGEKEKKK